MTTVRTPAPDLQPPPQSGALRDTLILGAAVLLIVTIVLTLTLITVHPDLFDGATDVIDAM